MNDARFFPRVTLRELHADDAGDLYAILSDHRVMQHYDMPPLAEADEARRLIVRWQQAEAADRALRWAIAERQSGRLIGTCGIHTIDWRHGRGDLGFELCPQWWGMGIMREVLPQVFAHAFGPLQLVRLGALVSPANAASIALLSRFGFKREGILRHYLRVGEAVRDVVAFSLLRSEYASSDAWRETIEI